MNAPPTPRRRMPRTALALAALAWSLPLSAQQPRPLGDHVYTVGDTLVGAVGGVAVDALGFIYVADFRETVYRVQPDGRSRVFATGLYGSSGNTVDADGNLIQSSFNGGTLTRFDRHGHPEIIARGLQGPVGVATSADSDALIVCNCRSNTLARVVPGGPVETFVESDLLNCPNGITRAGDGNWYVVNFSDDRMLKLTPDGTLTEFARLPGGGNGHVTFARGSLYATSFQGQRVYRVSLSGDVTPIAGTGSIGERDGPAREATFTFPNGIAAGPLGDRLYINDFINRQPPGVAIPAIPKSTLRMVHLESIAGRMAAALASGGIESMADAYEAFKNDPGTSGLFTEIEVNAYGYRLLGAGRADAALRVFELNAASYPASWNVWDSLAEGHMNAGNDERAIELYEKSLSLNPANENAKRMIEKIRSGG